MLYCWIFVDYLGGIGLVLCSMCCVKVIGVQTIWPSWDRHKLFLSTCGHLLLLIYYLFCFLMCHSTHI
ncbi:hypothetical protein Tsubulata_006205 [Turnera subulata]|uniref:Uncharacterized protein n=1 Tax=Turnera subulata TaxID=218843 RepID=A0A9Q0FB11_9ROSI|nr:hypothetical protein Tsubulata_006205 [Turnera subulata]